MPRSEQQRLVEDRLWELIEPLIPPRPGWAAGPRWERILFVLDTGCPRRDPPEELGCGSGHTALRRLRVARLYRRGVGAGRKGDEPTGPTH